MKRDFLRHRARGRSLGPNTVGLCYHDPRGGGILQETAFCGGNKIGRSFFPPFRLEDED